ncbi:GAP family protein [Mycolicibacterium poriferae]|uniref:Gap like protein n=1 Tax=Mycolicibacterium poriferae TaxID=39694 RepID=A0A6N4V6Z5_9MYCO|nr:MULTISPECIES: GAP family protein [Mycolicibacterium]MCG7583946.1 GAP family protein [Mycolicibacterium sp. OfavD-34-C]MCV7264072.1 GAP family protein [Mycolicibacterium poriferae]QFS89366.1 hypothetical protein FIV07_01345 [Mycobacterium sp. THAF192]BBX49788.1 hypothetical protein MPOR_08140 [Mycolicibacterium poriferae]
MWMPLLAMAIAVSVEPFRIGMTVVMINRPRPGLQLLAFLLGGFAMGIAVGVVVLFILRPALGSAHFTLPRVQIVVGAVVLLNAALVAAGVIGGRRRDGADSLPGRLVAPLIARAKQLLGGRSLWTAGAAGLGIALPSVDYLAALALIVASGTAATIQFGALVVFNVVAFALVEIPLLCYLVAPDRTRAALSALYDWVRLRGRYGVAALLVVVGAVLIGVGLSGL